MRQVQTKAGPRFKPSIEELTQFDEAQEGFCIYCGAAQEMVEPDARQYQCEACMRHGVYGAAELALMGWVE